MPLREKMQRFLHRKSAPKVRDGSVRHKNNWSRTPRYPRPTEGRIAIDRERPGEGYRHLLLRRDIERFLTLLPDWDELSLGLHAIVLAPGEWNCLGWHRPGVVAVCAWERKLPREWNRTFFLNHRPVLERLGVEWEPLDDEWEPGFLCKFTEQSARGFLLMHVLLHELGHHHDRMTTRSQQDAARGEPYAEQYALRHAEELWNRYFATFGW
jgi:hypothetical protein